MPRRVATGIYQLGLGGVNVFFVEDGEGELWLIDAGTRPGAERIGGGMRALGRAPQELRGIVITHLHGDHVGGLAAVKTHTGAEVWMQADDAAAVREGVRGRALEPGPGILRSVMVRVVRGRAASSTGDPMVIEHEVADGELLPFGATAVHTPGHTAGRSRRGRPSASALASPAVDRARPAVTPRVMRVAAAVRPEDRSVCRRIAR